MVVIGYDLYLVLSFRFYSQNQLNIYNSINAGSEECLEFRLFLDKMPNMYINLKD